jgi:hypothetical protein
MARRAWLALENVSGALASAKGSQVCCVELLPNRERARIAAWAALAGETLGTRWKRRYGIT